MPLVRIAPGLFLKHKGCEIFHVFDGEEEARCFWYSLGPEDTGFTFDVRELSGYGFVAMAIHPHHGVFIRKALDNGDFARHLGVAIELQESLQ